MIGGHHSTRAFKKWCVDQSRRLNEEGDDNMIPFINERAQEVDGVWVVRPIRECNMCRLSKLPTEIPGMGFQDTDDDTLKRLNVARVMGTVDNTTQQKVAQYAAISPFQ